MSSLLKMLCYEKFSKLLNDMKYGHHLGKNRPKVNHLLYMDDLKLYAKDKKDLKLAHTGLGGPEGLV